MAYTKGILERFAADIPNLAIRRSFEDSVAAIQFETRDNVEWCVDFAVEEALRGTIAEDEIQALRARVQYYVIAEDLELTK